MVFLQPATSVVFFLISTVWLFYNEALLDLPLCLDKKYMRENKC